MSPSSVSLPAKNAMENNLYSSKLINPSEGLGVQETYDYIEPPHGTKSSSANSEDHTLGHVFLLPPTG